jgi:geranylgeranyl diphosphate synthase type II
MSDLKIYLKNQAKLVDQALKAALPKGNVRPATLHQAMRYSVFAGGKRLRPILTLAAAEACGGNPEDALPLACSVECLHTYSLIHDDLPSMDDDDMRRGNPTCHKVYGEAVAVLAGDALQAFSFEMVGRAKETARYPMRALLGELASTAGSHALIAGQVMDMEGEGKKLTKGQVVAIHERKTAALLTTSLRFGAMSANASSNKLAGITQVGHSLGLAFQVIDDILDVTQSSAKLGKSAGKDEAVDKSTFPALIGLEKSRKEAAKLTAQAHRALKEMRMGKSRLSEIVDYMLERDY